jgi:hypothetical protein
MHGEAWNRTAESLVLGTRTPGGAREEDNGELGTPDEVIRRGSGGGRPAGARKELEEASDREEINGRDSEFSRGHARPHGEFGNISI